MMQGSILSPLMHKKLINVKINRVFSSVETKNRAYFNQIMERNQTSQSV